MRRFQSRERELLDRSVVRAGEPGVVDQRVQPAEALTTARTQARTEGSRETSVCTEEQVRACA